MYRYEFSKDNKRVGILVGLDDYFTDDEILSVCWFFETHLDCPNVDMTNTKSYFTDKGNRKFRKKIREIKKIANSKGINVICEHIEEGSLSDIVYCDVNQIVVRNACVA